jgi:predicted nucleic acid-binding protein
MEEIILDTNILIEILKGNEKILKFLDDFNVYYISSISEMELLYGALNKKELLNIKKFLENFNIIELNEKISKKATNLIFKYAKSHNLTIPDALIAATVIESNIPLFTLNLKDFKYIDEINLITFH